uniref:Putative secreted protein n=1 Tax=Rhipicephalus microplus TaxID=6941 RepID=A0A6M2D907_RHIMP
MLLSLQMLFLCAPLVAPIILLNETQHYPNRYSHYVFQHQCVPNTHFTSATTLFFVFLSLRNKQMLGRAFMHPTITVPRPGFNDTSHVIIHIEIYIYIYIKMLYTYYT